MPKKETTYCINRGVGRLLADAQRGTLAEPTRSEDRRVFFDDHLEQCRACRDEMINDANQFALSEIAEESCVEVEDLVERLGQTAKQLRDFARERDVPFEEVVLGILRGRRYVSTNSKPIRAASCVASTDA